MQIDLKLIGARLREMRTERTLTLADVAAATGLSISMVSSVERGATNASIGTLIALSDAIGASLVELFGVERGPDRSPVIKRDEQPVVTSETGVQRLVIYRDPARGVELAQNEYPSGAQSAENEVRHSGFEFGVVLTGELEVHLEDQVHYLRCGDAVAYSSTMRHRLVNPGPDTARTVWVNMYRAF